MIVEVVKDYNNSTNNRIRYRVTSDGYEKKNNLSLSQAKKIQHLIIKSINMRIKLRKLGIMSDR